MKPLPQIGKPLPQAGSRPLPLPRVFTRADMARDIELVGDGFRFTRQMAGDEPLLEGRMFQFRELQPGLVLHATQVRDLKDITTQVLQHPALKLSLLVSGASEFAFGRCRYHLGPESPGGSHHRGAVVSLAEPDMYRRQWRAGRRERKISITLKPEWLEQAGFHCLEEHEGLWRFSREHMAEQAWVPSARVLAAAEQILEPPALDPALQDLFVQARCLDIVVEALAAVSGARPAAPAPTRERQVLDRLHELLDSGCADGWSLRRIARHVGSNPTSLQQAFRGRTGMTIFDYQRQRRLQRAHDALSRDLVSVEQAASIAGYGNAANFATAFKRRFGVTPRQVRGTR